jgi:hypothetical protein
LRDDFPKIVLSETRSLPIPEIDFSKDGLNAEINTNEVTVNSGHVILDDGQELEIEPNTKTHDLLSQLARSTMEKHRQYRKFNLEITDYLGNYDSGSTLTDVGLVQPAEGVGQSILHETAEQKPNLRIEDVEIIRESPNTVEIQLSARYKPDDDSLETDRWGYTETELLPALRITDLTEIEADLIEAFVPIAIDKAEGFANFRSTATKSNSLIDRLKTLTLPAVSDVKSELREYIETKSRAEKIESEIMKTESLIDNVVIELFDIESANRKIIDEPIETLSPSLRSVNE